MPYKPSEREYRAMNAPLKPPEAGSEKHFESDYYVEGHAAVTNKPYLLGKVKGVAYYEKIMPGAFDECDLSDVILQHDHKGKVFARVGNKTLLVKPDEKGLFIAADLSKSAAAKEHYEEIANELITQMSLGFRVAEDGAYFDRKTNTRIVTKIEKVFDVSSVGIPANPSTTIAVRSMLAGSTEALAQELREQERKRLEIILTIITGGK